MYHRAVSAKVHRIFDELSAGDPSLFLDALAPRFMCRSVGESALGGRRTRRSEVEAWWARIFRLFPGVRFTVEDLTVAGTPWDTTVVTHVRVDSGSADGEPHHNEFVQIMRLHWGKIVSVLTAHDTHRLEVDLQRMAFHGVAEAAAPPIQTGHPPST